VTKARALEKRIRQEAKRQGVTWTLLRQGANHTVYDLDGVTIPIPRHSDLGEGLTREIYKQREVKLGRGWWRT
jgi:predicted RNA binding protein YcfA (HicA-like mRNA interferase family)